MLGWILLAIFVGFIVGCVGLVGYLELGYRIGRRRRERVAELSRGIIDGYSNGLNLDDRSLDSRERRRIVQRELDKLRR